MKKQCYKITKSGSYEILETERRQLTFLEQKD
jgi:hypothetical protein